MSTDTENGSSPAAEAAAERKPTERVILQAQRVVLLPAGLTDEEVRDVVKAAAVAIKGHRSGFREATAWTEVARITAASKSAAIRAYAGEPGTPDAKQGTFRAPTVTSWKDAERYAAPPTPLVERTVIE